MTMGQKLRNVSAGIVMLIMAVILIIDPEDGYDNVIFLLSVSLMISGLSTLIYYLLMARFMVGGRFILFKGLLVFDAGFFTLTLSDVPRFYVILYLVAVHAFAGFIGILRAVEVMRQGSKSWKLKLSQGIFDMLLASMCVIFISRITTVLIIYTMGMVYSGIMRIVSAFRKNDILAVAGFDEQMSVK